MPTLARPILAAVAALSLALAGCSSTTGPADASPDVVAEAGRDGSTGVCSAQNATGAGTCTLVIGYVWNGAACVGLSGCSCTGPDCGGLFMSQTACQSAHATCSDCRGAGCSSGNTCQPCLGASGVVYVCLPSGSVC